MKDDEGGAAMRRRVLRGRLGRSVDSKYTQGAAHPQKLAESGLCPGVR